MLTLFTKNSSRTGNAIIYGGESSGDDYFFLVETDFGNKMRLNPYELNEHFILGRVQSYSEWLRDRDALREQSRQEEPAIEVQQPVPEPLPRLTKKQWKMLARVDRVGSARVPFVPMGHDRRTLMSLHRRNLVRHSGGPDNLSVLTERGEQALKTRQLS